MNDDIIELGLLDDSAIVLDEAALALAAADHPEVDLAPYHELLVDIAEHLAEAGSEADSARQRADVLAVTLAETFGFAGDRADYDAPENADLIRVIDRRLGLPVSLSILYVSAARRVGWHADALDVPGHVLALVGDDTAPVVIDPFRGGAKVNPEQLAALMTRGHPGERPAVQQVATMPDRAVLVRLLANQATRAEAGGLGRRALTLYERMTSFAPAYPHPWWERARLELADGRVADARRSLTAMLEVTREPELRQSVIQMLDTVSLRRS